MQHGSDSRSAHRTRNLFKNALLRLLETESFAYISVKDIVETAEFNRTTFYNHYVDKFALLDDVTQDLLDDFGDALQASFQKYHPKSKILMEKRTSSFLTSFIGIDTAFQSLSKLIFCRRFHKNIHRLCRIS